MQSPHFEEDQTLAESDWTCREIRNQEPAGFTSLRQILNPRELPDADGLSDLELIPLLNEIEFELLQRRIQVDFLDALPPKVAYKGILQLLDSPIACDEEGFRMTRLDGCDSACESCFQLAYCPSAREVLGKEWRLAVEQAGINPSWNALLSKRND